MSKSKNLMNSPLRVSTYADLARYVQAFHAGHLNLLLLLGPAGVGKSRAMKEGAPTDTCFINGMASAFGIYKLAYQRLDQALVFDDLDGLHADRDGVRLFKCMCQTDAVKTLSWQTDAAGLDRENIPRSFETRSRIAIIANVWNATSANGKAFLDRGHVISFEPTALEVHHQAATWFWDQEVFNFVAQHLHLIKQHSLRLYFKAWELMRADLDWQDFVLSRFVTGKALEVARLLADSQFDNDAARAVAFERAGHGCRATFFNHARGQDNAEFQVPQITLPWREPPDGMEPIDEPIGGPLGPNMSFFRQLDFST